VVEPVPFVGNLNILLHHLLLSTLRRMEKLSGYCQGNFAKD